MSLWIVLVSTYMLKMPETRSDGNILYFIIATFVAIDMPTPNGDSSDCILWLHGVECMIIRGASLVYNDMGSYRYYDNIAYAWSYVCIYAAPICVCAGTCTKVYIYVFWHMSCLFSPRDLLILLCMFYFASMVYIMSCRLNFLTINTYTNVNI